MTNEAINISLRADALQWARTDMRDATEDQILERAKKYLEFMNGEDDTQSEKEAGSACLENQR